LLAAGQAELINNAEEAVISHHICFAKHAPKAGAFLQQSAAIMSSAVDTLVMLSLT
jgi:hypothetical protein